jgi:hypothetical protein
MSDWLVFLFKIGGFGAVVVLALWIMGSWILKRINAALDSYVTAYAQETAKIDARIERIEKLAEEQARLTRTVERIKDEIAAQAKSRDNRWAFRKEVYVNLINSITDFIEVYSRIGKFRRKNEKLDPTLRSRYLTVTNVFLKNISVAPLAMADAVADALTDNELEPLYEPMDPDGEAPLDIEEHITALTKLRSSLQNRGRNDLWGTPEAEAEGEAVSQAS